MKVFDSQAIETVFDWGKADGVTKVATVDQDSGRWLSYHWLVFQEERDGPYWACEYGEGLTEYQENEYPWEESDQVECFQVRPVEKIVIDWEMVR